MGSGPGSGRAEMLYSSKTLPLGVAAWWHPWSSTEQGLLPCPPTGLLAALQIEQLEQGTSLIIPITVTCWLQGTLAVMGSWGDEMKAI